MVRPLDAATSAAATNEILPVGFFLYLDILGDPLFCWSGLGDVSFGVGVTGDPYLDNQTFYGTGTIIEVSNAAEGQGGTDTLQVTLAGVDPLQPEMKQIITNRNRWQFRRAVCWMVIFDPVTLAIVGKPFRIRTGRMDKMPYTEDDNGGRISCNIEGQQAYGNEPLSTRYVEQVDINANDTSQNWAHYLANVTPTLGVASARQGYTGGQGGGGGLGGILNLVTRIAINRNNSGNIV